MCRRAFMEKEQLEKLSAFVDANKGKRKFTQSVELAVNFTGVDFTKQENRFNMEIKLPNSTGKVTGSDGLRRQRQHWSSAATDQRKVVHATNSQT